MSFSRAPEVEAHARAIAGAFGERFEYLAEASVGYLWAADEIVVQGRLKAGYAMLPTAMGQTRKILDWALAVVFGKRLDALVVVHQETWDGLSPRARVALVYHELCHLKHRHTQSGKPCYAPDGRPVLEIAGHDLEEFEEVLARFGTWHEGLAALRAILGQPETDEAFEAVTGALRADPA